MSQNRTYDIKLNAFESGTLLSMLFYRLSEAEIERLKSLIEQLKGHQRTIQEENGVKVEKLPTGLLKITDQDGTVIMREPYAWEEY